MPVSKNTPNYITYSPKYGIHKGKNYLYIESNLRWFTIRNYIKGRPEQFKDFKYFLVMGYNEDNKWDFGSYANSTSTEKIPLPEVIYDIITDKIYHFRGQLWNLK